MKCFLVFFGDQGKKQEKRKRKRKKEGAKALALVDAIVRRALDREPDWSQRHPPLSDQQKKRSRGGKR